MNFLKWQQKKRSGCTHSSNIARTTKEREIYREWSSGEASFLARQIWGKKKKKTCYHWAYHTAELISKVWIYFDSFWRSMQKQHWRELGYFSFTLAEPFGKLTVVFTWGYACTFTCVTVTLHHIMPGYSVGRPKFTTVYEITSAGLMLGVSCGQGQATLLLPVFFINKSVFQSLEFLSSVSCKNNKLLQQRRSTSDVMDDKNKDFLTTISQSGVSLFLNTKVLLFLQQLCIFLQCPYSFRCLTEW